MKEYDLTKIDVLEAYKEQKEAGAYNDIINDYLDPATKYCFYTLEERVQTSYMIKLACFRHLQDLLRQNRDDFPYYYDLDKAREILGFASLVPDVTTGKPQDLMLWQKFLLCELVAWRGKNNSKRFSKAIASIARTNGKTYLASIITIYSFLIEGEGLQNQIFLFVAPVSIQVDVGFSYIKSTFNYLAEIPALKKVFKEQEIAVLDDRVVSRKTQNKLLRLTFNSGKLDSMHARMAVGDEVADNTMIGKIKQGSNKISEGQVQIPDSQYLQISTAYPDSTSYLYSDENTVKNAMEHDNERLLDDYLCLVWCQDNLDETQKPETWVKSNPLLELPEKHDSMLNRLISDRDVALETGSLRDFQVKNLNIWLQTKENRFLELSTIEDNIIESKPFEIDGRQVFIGFDKSNFSDDTSISFMYPYQLDGENKYYVETFSWIPTARAQRNIAIKEKQDGIPYSSLPNAFLTKNDYGYINDSEVIQWLMEYIEEHQLKVIYFLYDQYDMSEISMWLEQHTELNVFPLKQDMRSLTEPTVTFQKAMDSHQITYTEDKMLITAMKNAVIYSNNNLLKIDKEKGTAKIDTLASTLDAWAMARYHFQDVNPVPDKGKGLFDGMSEDDLNNYFTNDFSF